MVSLKTWLELREVGEKEIEASEGRGEACPEDKLKMQFVLSCNKLYENKSSSVKFY